MTTVGVWSQGSKTALGLRFTQTVRHPQAAEAANELAEAILHLLGYVGAPLVRDAMLVATKVFADLRSEGS